MFPTSTSNGEILSKQKKNRIFLMPTKFFGIIYLILYSTGLLLVGSVAEAKSDEIIDLSNVDRRQVLNKHLRFYASDDNDFEPPKAEYFESSSKQSPNFGFSDKVWWAHFHAENRGNAKEVIFTQGYPNLDRFTIFVVQNEKVISRQDGGDTTYVPKSKINFRTPAFMVTLPSGKFDIYLRSKTEGSVIFDLEVMKPLVFFSLKSKEYSFIISMMAILTAMAAYNFMIYLQLRKLVYLIYVTFIFSLIGTSMAYSGMFGAIMPANIFLMNDGYLYISNLSAMLAPLFTIFFLSLRKRHKWLYYYCILGIVSPVVSMACIPFSYNMAGKIAVIVALNSSFCALFAGIANCIQRYRPAYFFTLAWSLLIFGNLMRMGALTGGLPSNPITEWSHLVGSVVEVILISLALSDRIRISEVTSREKIDALNRELIIFNEQLENEVDQKTELLEKLEEQETARTLFFHNTSHELRTPLNGIIGFLDLIKKKRYGEINSKITSQIGKTLHLAESLKLQINTILDLAKSKRGELTQYAQKFKIAELKIEADNLAEGLRLRQAGLNYTSRIENDNELFIGDQEKIFTIIRNLLGNAFKFKDPLRTNEISLLLSYTGNNLTIEVSDTGVGIPEDSQTKIFEEFGQVDGDARRSYEGSGLGLSMVNSFIQLMNGTVGFDSAVGKGTTFRVDIPQLEEIDIKATQDQTIDPNSLLVDIHPESLLAQKEEPDKFGILNHDDRSSKWNVFVIDDSKINCEVITEILKIDRYQIRYALSGPVGITQMKQKKPDLLLLDMMMPDMSGEDVLNAMKKDPVLEEIPIILITARASDEDRIFGLKIGADDYLPKPIVANELRLRVRNMIDRHRLLRQIESTTSKDKIVRLGELFGELSHELKNILQGASWLEDITEKDSDISATIMNLRKENQKTLAQGMLHHSFEQNEYERMQHLSKGPEDDYQQLRNRIRRNLATMDLAIEKIEPLWDETLENEYGKLNYLDSQLKIFRQNSVLKEIMNRCQEVTHNVLNYTREEPQEIQTQINERFDIVKSLLHAKNTRVGASWKIEIGEHSTSMKPNDLTQVFLNLGVNALDAVASLNKEDRWISTKSEVDNNQIHIDWTNGGPQIPLDVQEKIFNRGFSTKGEAGSGIGLFVSQRLVKEAGGDLTLVSDGENPCFRITLPLTQPYYDPESDDDSQVS